MAAYQGEEEGSHNEQTRPNVTKFGSLSLQLEQYEKQIKIWPQSGKHILAHYDDETVVVYQAYNPEIAKYAVRHQKFGGPLFSFDRMSWIKTNFLWMMYRCGWAQKQNQERVLAIWLRRQFFENLLQLAHCAKMSNADRKSDQVRLQWDPDHCPIGEKETRRAIQLGLRDKALADYADPENMIKIKDITKFVHEQSKFAPPSAQANLMTPRERVYVPTVACDGIGLDFQPVTTVVKFSS